MASRKVDSNVLIGLQGCQDLKGKTLKGDVGGKWWEGRPVIVFFFSLGHHRVCSCTFLSNKLFSENCETNSFQKGMLSRHPEDNHSGSPDWSLLASWHPQMVCEWLRVAEDEILLDWQSPKKEL